MSRCPHARHVQDFLDGELAPDRARAFEAHLDGCAPCAAEAASYRALFGALGGSLRLPPAQDPGLELTERILDRVVPSRLRRRWVAAAGWVYGTVSAASTFLFVSWIALPSTHVWLAERYSVASLRLVQAVLFAFQAITRSWLEVLQGWGWMEAVMTRVAPLARAFARPLADPLVVLVGLAATVACAGLLWWMRSERRAVKQGVRNVSMLGF